MPFADLTDAQRNFLATHTKSGKTLAKAAPKAPVEYTEADVATWLEKVSKLRADLYAAPSMIDTSKLMAALDKSQMVLETKFDPRHAEKALTAVQAAYDKSLAIAAENNAKTSQNLNAAQVEFSGLLKLAFPEKKTTATRIKDLLQKARTQIDAGEFTTAERAVDEAQRIMASARIGVDARAAKDLKPADLEVLMKTQDGQAQLDAIVDNLTDDVPPNVMVSILEARFSLDRRLFQSTSDREGSMLDKSKHGAMLDTDSPKLKKYYKQLMDKQAAEQTQAE